jgi:hypothetical protein
LLDLNEALATLLAFLSWANLLTVAANLAFNPAKTFEAKVISLAALA